MADPISIPVTEDKSWQDFANCLGVDPDLFFPERGASTREAKEVCRGCVVREDCLEYALANGEKFGIWGGMSERERRRIRRQRALARAAAAQPDHRHRLTQRLSCPGPAAAQLAPSLPVRERRSRPAGPRSSGPRRGRARPTGARGTARAPLRHQPHQLRPGDRRPRAGHQVVGHAPGPTRSGSIRFIDTCTRRRPPGRGPARRRPGPPRRCAGRASRSGSASQRL